VYILPSPNAAWYYVQSRLSVLPGSNYIESHDIETLFFGTHVLR